MITQTSFFGFPLRTSAQRRFVVCLYYLLLVALAGGGFGHDKRLPFALVCQTLLLGGLLGGVRTGGPVKAFTEPHFPLDGDGDTRPLVLGLGAARERLLGSRAWTPLDERETGQRDRAHFLAYRVLICVAAAAAVAYWCAWAWYPALVAQEAPLLVWFMLMLTVSLPQAVLLWTEPGPADVESDEHSVHA